MTTDSLCGFGCRAGSAIVARELFERASNVVRTTTVRSGEHTQPIRAVDQIIRTITVSCLR